MSNRQTDEPESAADAGRSGQESSGFSEVPAEEPSSLGETSNRDTPFPMTDSIEERVSRINAGDFTAALDDARASSRELVACRTTQDGVNGKDADDIERAVDLQGSEQDRKIPYLLDRLEVAKAEVEQWKKNSFRAFSLAKGNFELSNQRQDQVNNLKGNLGEMHDNCRT